MAELWAEWQRKCRGGGAGEVKRLERHFRDQGRLELCAKAEPRSQGAKEAKMMLPSSRAHSLTTG